MFQSASGQKKTELAISQSAEFPHNKFAHKNTRTTGSTTQERETG